MSTDLSPPASPLVFDVTDAQFQTAVIDRSHTTPVVVDLWAEWCGPCKQLGPMLERAVTARGGDVVLAKVDTEANPEVARAFQVQSIPAVFGLRDGKVVAQFVGVRPEAEIERFLDDLGPSEADRAVQRARVLDGDEREAALRHALELEPTHREAAVGLAELLVERDPSAAIELVLPHRPDPAAEAVVTRAELARGGADDADLADLRAAVARGDADGATLLELGRSLAAAGDYEEGLDHLLAAVQLGGEVREPAREQIVALFNVLGDADPRVQAARPRLARALF
ncbi:tetratricopeptide repeat protein [Nitriliruptor alkaliphilus]|uniref:tetratricopeptide repeat protein n=1 Tax=Nitriliruptor alkaliphilus TaxID=427918 RepID=UPI000695F148|nr:tetratricopeptide repeat protein [Nitriliruptor alkaliphilus]